MLYNAYNAYKIIKIDHKYRDTNTVSRCTRISRKGKKIFPNFSTIFINFNRY